MPNGVFSHHESCVSIFFPVPLPLFTELHVQHRIQLETESHGSQTLLVSLLYTQYNGYKNISNSLNFAKIMAANKN